MADPTKAELGAALARVLGAGGVALSPGASPETRKAVVAELQFQAGVSATRPEPAPEANGTSDDADHERVMVERSIVALRERADRAEAEALDAYLADKTHRERELRSEAERLRALANRHEATLRVKDRSKVKP